MYRIFLSLAWASLSLESQPHIVIAIADDLGWSDLGYQNASGIRTPHIDRLARNGIILTNHYVQPLCSPSRASLLTGRYPIHLGAGLNENVFSPDEDIGLPENQTLLSEKLKQLGYKTALFGKWHLGHSRTGYLPTRRGFDRFYGFYTGAIDYFSHNQTAHRCKDTKQGANFLDFRDQEKTVDDRKGEYSSGIFNEKAVKFIEDHDGKQPLFLVMSYQNVHEPLQVPRKYSKMYHAVHDRDRRLYAGMTSYLDDSVNMLTKALKKQDLWKNTIFLFMSDNGGNPTYSGYNWPLRGAKSTLWEGGIRSVSFLNGGFLKSSGFQSDALVHVSDWFPTLLNLADKRRSAQGKISQTRMNRTKRVVRNSHGSKADNRVMPGELSLDGYDVWNAITSRYGKSPRSYILHNINSQSYSVRKGKWKLISEIDMGWLKPPEGTTITVANTTARPLDQKTFTGYILDPELPRVHNGLFDMTNDEYERYDVSAEYPRIVKDLYNIVEIYRKTMVPHDREYKCNMKAIQKAKDENAWGPLYDQ